MKNKFTDKDLDLWIRMNAVIFDHLPQEPLDDLGANDDWMINKFYQYISGLKNSEFIVLLKKIIKLSEEKYYELVKKDIGYLVLGEVDAVLSSRPTKKYLEKFPNDNVIPLDLSMGEEEELVSIITELRDRLKPMDQYRADLIIEQVTGKLPYYKYKCKRCIYRSNTKFIKCPVCG